ncbi:MAG: class I SAM-dependent methyltransferase [Eubacteriales bacterium]
MPNEIKDYYNLVQMPWGRIFYDQIYRQLALPESPKLKILDFGSGFGVTVSHYAKWHEVTAIEPNPEMTELRYHENEYVQISGDFKALGNYNDHFDLVICHNVIEYTRNQEEIFAELSRVLKPGGRLSIVKHNTYGRAMSAAVFEENPQKALDLIFENKDVGHTFGNRRLYANSEVTEWANKNRLILSDVFGIRTFIALIQNNEIKFNTEWYDKMLELEDAAGRIDEYKAVAFFNHLLFIKRC